MDENYEKGIVNAFDPFKGFGFIRREKGRDVFFFYDELPEDELEPTIGDVVCFTIKSNKKGPRAYNIRVLGASEV